MKRDLRIITLAISLMIAVGVIMAYANMFEGLDLFITKELTFYLVAIIIMIILTYGIPLFISFRNGKIKNNKISTANLKEDGKFDLIYTEIREKYSQDLAKIRKGLRPITIIVSLLGAAIVIMFAWMKIAETNMEKYFGFIINNQTMITVIPVITMLLFFGAYCFYSFRKTDYDKKYKTGVVADIVNKANRGLTYSMKSEDYGKELLEKYELAAFDTYRFNRDRREDFITGKLTDKITLSMGELDLDEVVGGRRNRTTIDVFNGLFVYVHGINEFKGTLKILNNNNKMKEKNTQNLAQVKMDSTEFENLFNVYADNSVVAMRVLTSDIMQKMVEFETRLGIHYEVMVSGTEIFMRFFTTELFEPAIFNESREKDRVRAYYEVIKLITDVSIELDKIISEVEI